MSVNDERDRDTHTDDSRDNDIKKEMHIKTEYEVTDEHKVKNRTENKAEWENGIKDEVTDDINQDNTNIEEIYIKSEPVDTSEFEDGPENADVTNFDSREIQEICCTPSIEDLSQYNHNTNFNNIGEINIKSECGDDDEHEESAACQDTARGTSCNNSNEGQYPSVNNLKQRTTTLHKCNICMETFERPNTLRKHKRIHSGHKPFECILCNKTFSWISHLIIHKRVHSGERPFKCDQCDKAFSQKPQLASHKRTHSGEKPFKCDQCDKAFSQLATLMNHRRLHSGEKPFECDVCDKAFSQKPQLISHKRIHSKERPIKYYRTHRTHHY